MRWIYSIGISFYSFAVSIAGLWNKKAKKRTLGSRQKIDLWPKTNLKRHWFHCASLGEFEMARPIIEKLKKENDCEIIVTFFSPSGYEIRKKYEWADFVYYLPYDTPQNAKQFLQKIQPDFAYFIKYEFWVNFIAACQKNNIKTYSLASIFKPDQRFFKPWGRLFLKTLQQFDHIFVQDEASAKLLGQHNITNTTVIGDLRVDRVLENSQQPKKYKNIEQFTKSEDVIIFGSTWAEDEAVVLPYLLKNDQKAIIAPHEVDEKHITKIAQQLGEKAMLYSVWQHNPKYDIQILVIDNIGMLANLYQYGKIAYIGGAFRTGLHNILEPAAFGLPVVFGPNHQKFPEGQIFIDKGIGISITDTNSFENAIQHFQKENVSSIIENYLNENKGASEKVLKKLF